MNLDKHCRGCSANNSNSVTGIVQFKVSNNIQSHRAAFGTETANIPGKPLNESGAHSQTEAQDLKYLCLSYCWAVVREYIIW